MIRNKTVKKSLSWFFLGLMTVDILIPHSAFALTGGPGQPETKQFVAAGTGDMVDLFTGDFQYNIPLLDIDGYPVNLNYQAGAGLEEEASWVGMGWNLNVGAINRSLRGIADDADGDSVTIERYMRPKITAGGHVNVSSELFGIDGLKGTFGLNVFSDNYTGMGAAVSMNIGLSLTNVNGSKYTPGASIGLTSSSQGGVDVTPQISMAVEADRGQIGESMTGSVSMGYNTRQGLKAVALGTGMSMKGTETIKMKDGKPNKKPEELASGALGMEGASASVSFNTPDFYPKSNISFKSRNSTYSFDFGGAATAVFLGAGASGYKTVREVAQPQETNRAFGFLYAQNGKNAPDALMDFMREKDNPVNDDMNNIAVPIATPDVFSYSGQAGSGQFRLHRGGAGVLFDHDTKDFNDANTLGGQFGVGAYFHGGIKYYEQEITNTTGKWKKGNEFLKEGDYVAPGSVKEENAYFKAIGEKTAEDASFVTRILGETPVRVDLNKQGANKTLWYKDGEDATYTAAYKKDGRQLRNVGIKYLTAGEAHNVLADKPIQSHQKVPASFKPATESLSVTTEDRVTADRKASHISELTVQGADGRRMVYGIPVYNLSQEEYTFSVRPLEQNNTAEDIKNSNQVKGWGNANNVIRLQKGDQYYSKEVQPAYATSYLLTEVLSSDYEDVTGNGITPDDIGNGVKFNYNKAGKYRWRAPFEAGTAHYNPGVRPDEDDDKASFVTGEKELWYLQSIESKTKIAYFITEARFDAIAALKDGGVNLGATRQQRLMEIRIYSKSDLTKPLKSVHFRYDYTSHPGTPNVSSVPGENPTGGKLTLTKVWFQYDNSTKGQYHPYTFSYYGGEGYDHLVTDKWGNYKAKEANKSLGIFLYNNDYPYTLNNSSTDQNAQFWNLKEIITPTGSQINVEYESDDYAYVQDKRAMEMIRIESMLTGSGQATNEFKDAKIFRLAINTKERPSPNTTNMTAWFKDKFLNGSDYMYGRFFTNVSGQKALITEEDRDFIAAYGKVNEAVFDNDYSHVNVRFETVNDGGVDANPFISAAWQRMRLDMPKFAYPGYQSRVVDDRSVGAAVDAIVYAIKTLGELVKSFPKRAYRDHFASKVDLQKSFVRIVEQSYRKRGGGHRVKTITMKDGWDAIASEQSKTYGQAYEYKMEEGVNPSEYGKSSGVAAFEPANGGDENPLRLPDKYKQRVTWGLNNYYYLEEPFGETLFPAPSVGYSKVTVYNINGVSGERDLTNSTGYSSAEFYTTRDFPVEVQRTPLQKKIHKPGAFFAMFGGSSTYQLAVSQGFSIILNDMNGKPKAERTYDKGGQQIAATEYNYAVDKNTGKLSNSVSVVDEQGVVKDNEVIGREIDMFVDMRQAETINIGKSRNAGVDVIPAPWGALPIIHPPFAKNTDYRSFRSASLVKTIQYYGVLTSVVKRVNGSSITQTNLVFDKNTGNPVITSTQNEFEDQVYSVNIPAYWNYVRMGRSSQTLGMVIPRFESMPNGVPASGFASLLCPGDELIDVSVPGFRFWVIEDPVKGKLIVDETGRVREVNGTMKIVRSGYRNNLNATMASYVCLTNPVSNGKLKLLTNEELESYKVLNASAVLYNEKWGKPADCRFMACFDGYTSDGKGNCIKDPLPGSAADFTVLDGSNSSSYGNRGAQFFDEGPTNTTVINSSIASYWRNTGNNGGRLNAAGIWMGVPTDKWWGFEKCFTVPGEGSRIINIGFAADEGLRIYIDNALFYAVPDLESNSYYELWRIKKKMLTAGQHTIRVHAINKQDLRAVAVEIYDSPEMTLVNGDAQTIERQRLFSTSELLDKPTKAHTFTSDGLYNVVARHFYCADGVTPVDICSPIPGCGSVPAGTCIAPYEETPDGQFCEVKVQTNRTPGLTLVSSEVDPAYNTGAAVVYKDNGTVETLLNNAPWRNTGSCGSGGAAFRSSSPGSGCSEYLPNENCGPLNSHGVWLPIVSGTNWWGVNACLRLKESKVYYIGMSADSKVRVFMNGALWKTREAGTGDKFAAATYELYPLYLPKGTHRITVEAQNVSGNGAVCVEVFDNTLTDLKFGVRNVMFSLESLLCKEEVDTYVGSVTTQITARRYTCGDGGEVNVCSEPFSCNSIPRNFSINPYITGYLGNWQGWKDKIFLTGRAGDQVTNTGNASVGIRTSGYLKDFKSFWYFASGKYDTSANAAWVSSREVTLLDNNSQELENIDALKRYSSARFGFKNMLPVAVAANARQREVFYDAFEDYKFNMLGQALPCETDAFDIRRVIGSDYASWLDADVAHSGNYSLKLNKPLELTTYVIKDTHKHGEDNAYLLHNTKGEFYRNPVKWMGMRGFAPVNSGEYLFSAWVKDGLPGVATVGIQLKMNTTSVTLTTKAQVEGWKLVEGTFTVPNAPDLSDFKLTISGSTAARLDDIRILPVKGSIKTYAYDERTLRVMAELDENNYATFYEYDDEGSLVRVKKETERGILTIKESRSSLRKRNL